MELKNKFKNIELSNKNSAITQQSEDSDVIDALVGLGYPIDTARDAYKSIENDIVGVDNKIKECLKILGK